MRFFYPQKTSNAFVHCHPGYLYCQSAMMLKHMFKKYILLGMILCCAALVANAQATAIQTDPQALYQEALAHYRADRIHIAAPLFKRLYSGIDAPESANQYQLIQDLKFYLLACALKQNDPIAELPARQFVELEKNAVQVQQLSFELAAYFFRKENFAESLTYYEKAGIAHLSNEQILLSKFRQAYCLFHLQRFAAAKPLFASILQVKDNALFADANYYYGFILFAERNYTDALRSFDTLMVHPTYSRIVPFYIASIYYAGDQKAKALKVALEALKKADIVYGGALRQLAGHIYYEQLDFKNALPYLEQYAARVEKISREDQYKLSVSYFETGNDAKAIQGFQQLSGRDDALSQAAMYLLAKAYLQKGDKENARNAFGFSAANNSNAAQREISLFYYSKLSYELGYQGLALSELKKFLQWYPSSTMRQEATELLVATLSATSNFREALQLLETLDNPTEETKKLYPVILYGRAAELINDQLFARADELLSKVLLQSNNTSVLPLTYFWKGEIAMRNGKADEAIRFFNSYLQTNHKGQGEAAPQEANYNLGYCYLQKENYAQALTYFQKLTGNITRDVPMLLQDAYLRLGDCYYMLRNYKAAQKIYEQVLAFSWSSADYALYQQAIILGISNAKAKIDLLQQLQNRFPASSLNVAAKMEIASTYMSAEQFSAAIPYLQAVAENQYAADLKQRAMLELGIAYYNTNRNDEAIATYRQLAEQYPNSEAAEDALENLRSLYVQVGKPQAYADFLTTIGKKLAEAEADSLAYAAADVQMNEGGCANAITLYDQYLSRFPSGNYALQAQFYRSSCYTKQEDWKNALPGYEYVIAQGSSPWLEQASLLAARTAYFDLQDYPKAENYFLSLRNAATTDANRLEALRGLIRSMYPQKKFSEAAAYAKALLEQKNIGADDKALSNLTIARDLQMQKQAEAAIQTFKNVLNVNKGAWAAEARYGIAEMYFETGNVPAAEKAAFEVINKSGSYDFWVTRAYILLGDVYFKQKDFFNAKATFQSVALNAADETLKKEANEKLALVNEAEKKGSKVEN